MYWNLCAKFGCHPKCLGVIRTLSAHFEGLKVKRMISSSIHGFNFIYDLLSLWIIFDDVFGLVGMIRRGPGALGCDSRWFQTILTMFGVTVFSKYQYSSSLRSERCVHEVYYW